MSAPKGCPATTASSAAGHQRGLPVGMHWKINDSMTLLGALGLDAHIF